MSPRRMREPESRGADLAWSVLLVVASVLGGLAAADITHESSVVAVLFSLIVGAIMVVVLYSGLLDQRNPAAQRRAGPPAGHGPGGPAPGHALPPAGGRLPGEATVPLGPRDDAHAGERATLDPPVQPAAVRLVQSQAGGDWWEEHVAARSHGRPGRGSAQAGPRKVDLSQFLDQAHIAQCPNCAAFRVDVDNRAAEWLFGCQQCGQRWTWQPGTPWPAIHVRPDARGRANRPRA